MSARRWAWGAIERVASSDARLIATIRIASPRFLRTGSRADLVERAVRLLPGLAAHRCDNPSGCGILRELRDTETAHLLEHIACELMALAGSPRNLRGRTWWDFGSMGAGVFSVMLEFDDEAVAREALDRAGELVEWLVCAPRNSDPPDVGAVVDAVRQARSPGPRQRV